MKPTYGTIESDHKEALKVIRKERALFNFMNKVIPIQLESKLSYSVSSIGTTMVRIFITMDESFSTDDILTFMSFGKTMKSKRCIFEKFFREDSGKFAYRIQRKYKYTGTTYTLFFEDAPNIDGCEVKKKTIEKEVFYSDCGELRKTF